MSNLFSLEGQNAVVTGGGRGLGRAMASGMAEHGANIAIIDIDSETGEDAAHEMEGLGVKSMALQADITDEDQAFRAIGAVADTWKTSAVRGKSRHRTVSLDRSMSYGLFCPGTI